MNKLWYQSEKTLAHTKYNVICINNTNIFIMKDPADGWNERDAKQIDAWINVSDTPCNSLDLLPWKCERYWFPIAEVHKWTYNHAFWIKSVLDNLVFKRNDVKNIVIHCHAGIRRSPISLFMWLTSLYGVTSAAKILWPRQRKLQKSKIDNLRKGGNYGELCLEIENFYKVYNLNPGKSFESVLLDFEKIAKKEVPLPERLLSIKRNKRLTKKQIIKSLFDWYENKFEMNKSNAKLNTKNIFYYGFLIKAEQFFRNNKCNFSENYYYNWYINQLLKRDYWYNPIVISKTSNKVVKKNNLAVIELSEYLEKNSYPKVKIKHSGHIVVVS